MAGLSTGLSCHPSHDDCSCELQNAMVVLYHHTSPTLALGQMAEGFFVNCSGDNCRFRHGGYVGAAQPAQHLE